MLESNERQTILDEEHLKLLVLGYRIAGAVSLVMSLLGLLYLGLGILFASVSSAKGMALTHTPGQAPPAIVAWFLAALGGAFFLLLVLLGGLKFWVASCLQKRRHRTFIQVVAALTCLGIPYGTVLGALTFIVLSRPSVRDAFAG